ncbi:Hypothetical predicted protein [Olea europaea subsp. europaea]|uniref:Uncharacterized protein n=1 Tax=Olea europaea subsp. europaea TaxID=158383 RepID=A0A8S0S400_OLEEU|nr:Hypothetical predicted protein [Olea europaea subsp. europaea]
MLHEGFRKVDPDQWEFANEEFIRGQRHLLKNIHRRKPIHSHSGQGNAVPLTDVEREELEKEIDKLKHEKVLLESEVERRAQENRGYEYEIRSLGQKLQNIDHRQRQLMTTLAQLLQKPRYVSNLMEHLESNNKKRRLLALNYLHDEATRGDSQIMTFQAENPSTSSLPSLNSELVDQLDSSLNFWEKFVHEINQIPSEDFHDFSVLPQPSPVTITEMPVSSGDSDLICQTCSPKCHITSSPSRDLHSSPELAACSTCVDSLAISSICIAPSGIDVNMSPTNVHDIDIDISKDLKPDVTVPSVSAGPNDVFWQQFLVEAPGAGTQEVHSERRDLDDTRDPSESLDARRTWWNVEKLTPQMGHFA